MRIGGSVGITACHRRRKPLPQILILNSFRFAGTGSETCLHPLHGCRSPLDWYMCLGRQTQPCGFSLKPVSLTTFITAIVILAEAAPPRLPLAFEQNRGQAFASVRFLARTPDYQLNLKRGEAEIHFKSQMLLIRFIGANHKTTPQGRGRLDGLIRYVEPVRPAGMSEAPKFASVRYESIYPGIDLVFYGRRSHIEYDFVISPEADPNRISLVLEGADHLEVDDTGDLIIRVGEDTIHMKRPAAFQHKNSKRHTVEVRYNFSNPNTITFALGDYDRSLALTID